MSQRIPKTPVSAIGIDLGDRKSHVCVLDEERQVVKRRVFSMTRADVQRAFEGYPRSTVVAMEVSSHSPWVSRILIELGLDVIVADSRQLKLITQSRRKTDRRDAELLARLAASDRDLLRPIQHRGEAAQQVMTMLRARDGVVRLRAALVNQVRGSLKSHGYRLQGGSTQAIHKRIKDLPEELQPALAPLLDLCGAATARIKEYDLKLEKLAEDRFPETRGMREVQGVGLLTSLSVSLVLQDPRREHDRRRLPRQRAIGHRRGADHGADRARGRRRHGDGAQG